ncbi:MAG: glycosyltransferase family 4 protein, partial [Verrucomicrobiota bacterium]
MTCPTLKPESTWRFVSQDLPSNFSTGKERRLAAIARAFLNTGRRVEFHCCLVAPPPAETWDTDLWSDFDSLVIWNLSGREIDSNGFFECYATESISEGCGASLSQATFDGVVFTRIALVSPLWHCCPSSCLRVLELDEMESRRALEFVSLDYTEVSGDEKRSYAAKKMLERRWIPEFDLVTLSSQKELARAESLLGAPAPENLTVWPNIVPEPPALTDSDNTEFRLLFVGHLSYAPNHDGVLWFAKEVLPLIRETYPDARFDVIGLHCPAPLATELHELGCSFLGPQRDLLPYYRKAMTAVIPLRAGTGTRIKIL